MMCEVSRDKLFSTLHTFALLVEQSVADMPECVDLL